MRRILLALNISVLVACASPSDRGGDESALPENGDATPNLAVELATGPVIINEVLANEQGSDPAGEFVELLNRSQASVDLSGWSLSDATSVRYVFPQGTQLAAGRAVVVQRSLSLGNSGDSVKLTDGSGAQVDGLTYASDLAKVDGVSMNRGTDGTVGQAVLHTTLSTLSSSPGTRTDGTPFGPPVETDGGTDGGTDAGTDGGTGGGGGDPGDGGDTFSLRLLSGNISSGSQQSYDTGEGIRIFQALKPDVALVQEANYGENTPADLRTFVDTAFGPGYFYTRETGAQIPNAIVSRWPILESGQWNDPRATNRDFAWARIDVPGPRDLWAVSVHLLTSNSSDRFNEASTVVAQVVAKVPDGDYLLIGGDLNTGSRSESCLSKFGQVVLTSGPYPADSTGNGNTNRSRNDPYDWVMVDRDLSPFQVPTKQGNQTFANGLVFDSRRFSPLSDATPVRSGDSNSENMQHMAVVRDFVVPAH